MAMNFAEALATKIGSIERPKLPPIGAYDFQITKVPAMNTRGEFDVVDFQCQAVAASDEVDADELTAYGPLKDVTARLSFLFDKNDEKNFKSSLFRIRTFLEEHVGCADASMSLKEALSSSVNQRFRATTRIRADKNNPEVQYFEIDKTAPIT